MFQELSHLQFTLPQILSLIGLIQCVYVLVYMAFHAGGLGRIVLPVIYFLLLASAFLLDFSGQYIGYFFPKYSLMEWCLWFMGPPVSVLLMIQIARITQTPPLRSYWILSLLPLAGFAALLLSGLDDESSFLDWLMLTGFLAGVISLFAMWSQRPLLAQLAAQPAGKARYWLIIALVAVNLCFLTTVLLSLTEALSLDQTKIIRTIWGLGFVYLAGTSLFRVYPQAIRIVERVPGRGGLSGEDEKIVARIENLLDLDKVYQAPSYNRVNLAQELGVSETNISRIINIHFGKTLPQLFSERRIADAKRLLTETDMPIKTIAEEVGFNSIASFNRVFKDMENVSPGQFRATHSRK